MDTASIEALSVRGRYRPLFELGHGGMARVYLAESLASGLRKVVVLKVLKPQFSADRDVRVAFLREAELSAQMNHPNVVQVLEVADADEAPVMVMEYLDGIPLSSLLKHKARELPMPLRLLIFAHVLAGLHHFHELRDLDGAPLDAVHRDVSPQNVMVLHDGLVKVLDFGIAKTTSGDGEVTRAGVIKGKIHYMPPEQLLGEGTIDRRADIFAVGVMLWEAIALRRMWRDTSETSLLKSLAAGEVPKLREFVEDVPESLLVIVDRATAVDRNERFTTAQEMQGAIEQTFAEQGWFAHPGDLAQFMLQHFGETRREQDLKVKEALRTSGGSYTRIFSAREESARPTARTSSAGFAPVFHRRARAWLWVGAAASLAAIAGAWELSRRLSRPMHASVAPATVSLEVEAQPGNATIFLGGEPLGTGRFAGQRVASERKLLLEVRAPGHHTETKELVLRRDMALQIVLRPEVVVAATPEPIPTANQSSTVQSSVQAAPARTKTTRSAPSPAETSGNRSSKCKRPYTFGPDGVKTFRAECF